MTLMPKSPKMIEFITLTKTYYEHVGREAQTLHYRTFLISRFSPGVSVLIIPFVRIVIQSFIHADFSLLLQYWLSSNKSLVQKFIPNLVLFATTNG